MAKPKKSTKELLKWKKKRWVKITAPQEFRNNQLGESLVMKADDLLGKTIEVNLMAITGDIKKQNINVKFLIDRIKDGQAMTRLISYRINNASVKRMIRRSRDRIDHSFTCKTKDGVEIKVKPLVITINNTSQPVQSLLRKKIEFLIKTYAAKTMLDDILGSIVGHKIQNELKKQLKDIYPIRTSEIRWVHVINKDSLVRKAEEKPAKKETTEKQEAQEATKAKETGKTDKPEKKAAEKPKKAVTKLDKKEE